MPDQVRRRAGIKLRRLWHAHRWHLLAAIVVLPLLAAMVHSAIGGAESRVRPPSRGKVCPGAKQLTDEVSSRHPEARDSLESIEEQACTQDPVMAPTVEPAPLPATQGCHLLPGTNRRSPAPVTAAEPARAVPFFAPRSGRLPATGTPSVGGARLPAGTRCGPFWSTDAGVADAIGLARKLADAFPETGLWPVLWPELEPDSYINGGNGLARVDAIDAETILKRGWRAFSPKRPFPGLAAAEPAAERLKVEPFDDRLEASLEQPPGGPYLMLVPVNRPADVLAVLGQQTTVYYKDPELSAVLRSWEERFGAVVTTLGAGTVGLVVGAPPHDRDQLDRLAVELGVLAPDMTTEDLRLLLRSDRPAPVTTFKHYWVLGWPD